MSRPCIQCEIVAGHAYARDTVSGVAESFPLRDAAEYLGAQGGFQLHPDQLEAFDLIGTTGAKLGRKIKKAVKTVAKKTIKPVVKVAKTVAKSKVLRKVAMGVATGGASSAMSATLKGLKVAKKLAKKPAKQKQQIAKASNALATGRVPPKAAPRLARATGVSPNELKALAAAKKVQTAAKKGNPKAKAAVRGATAAQRLPPVARPKLARKAKRTGKPSPARAASRPSAPTPMAAPIIAATPGQAPDGYDAEAAAEEADAENAAEAEAALIADALPSPDEAAQAAPDEYLPDEGGDAYADEGGDAYADEGGDAYADEGGDAYADEGGDAYADEGGDAYADEGEYEEISGTARPQKTPAGRRKPKAAPKPARSKAVKPAVIQLAKAKAGGSSAVPKAAQAAQIAASRAAPLLRQVITTASGRRYQMTLAPV